MDEDNRLRKREYMREYMQKRRAAARAAAPGKNCLECGAGFKQDTQGGNQRYCSEECGRANRLRRRRDTEYTPKPIICVQCSGPIEYKSGRRRFCSNQCQVAYTAEHARWKVKGLSKDHGMEERCGICGRDDRKLVIDHDHACCPRERSCGKCVRGFLCHACNVAIGLFLDDPELIMKAAIYIESKRAERLGRVEERES